MEGRCSLGEVTSLSMADATRLVKVCGLPLSESENSELGEFLAISSVCLVHFAFMVDRDNLVTGYKRVSVK